MKTSWLDGLIEDVLEMVEEPCHGVMCEWCEGMGTCGSKPDYKMRAARFYNMLSDRLNSEVCPHCGKILDED